VVGLHLRVSQGTRHWLLQVVVVVDPMKVVVVEPEVCFLPT
jgi:hypothetical protein